MHQFVARALDTGRSLGLTHLDKRLVATTDSTGVAFISTVLILCPFGPRGEYEGCRMRSGVQAGWPEFMDDPFNNQRGKITMADVGVTSDRPHRPVEVVSMERVD